MAVLRLLLALFFSVFIWMEIFLDLFLVMVRLLPMEAAFLAAFFLVDLEALKSSSSEEDSLSDGSVLSLCWIQSKRWGERRALVNYERTRQHCLSK